MPFIVTCVFREPAKSYYMDPGELDLKTDQKIVAQTTRGVELGRVKFKAREIPEDKLIGAPQAIMRAATPDDVAQDAANREWETQTMVLVRERINYHDLNMKPIKLEVMLDRTKLFFYYESEERVDFRDLLRDLSQRLGMRMQFQQVNAREAAKMLGGVGPCGQPLCCATLLTSMPPVTLKMAKDQGLSLTPSKISGACGRLMCCLRYEVDFYRDQSMWLPRPGTPVDTPEGPGHVIDVNAISEKIVVKLGDGRHVSLDGGTLRDVRTERGPVSACSNHVNQGGSCGGAAAGGCSSGGGGGGCGSGGSSKKSGGGCGKPGGCGCASASKAKKAQAAGVAVLN